MALEFLTSPTVKPLTAKRVVVTGTGGILSVSSDLIFDDSSAPTDLILTGFLSVEEAGTGAYAGGIISLYYEGHGISANTQVLNLDHTWNSGAKTYCMIFGNALDTASAAASQLISLQVSSVEKFAVDKTGAGTLAVSLTCPDIYGGTGSAGDLDLLSTSHATKGKIRFGGSSTRYYDENLSTMFLPNLYGGTGSAGTLDFFSTTHATKGKVRFGTAADFFDEATLTWTFGVSLTCPDIYGGTTSAAPLDLFSTSHATKGKIRFGGSTTFFYDEANTLLSLGNSAPTGSRLEARNIAGVSGPLVTFLLQQTTVQTSNTTDTGLYVLGEIVAASASTQAALRAGIFIAKNTLTGGGAITTHYTVSADVQTSTGSTSTTAAAFSAAGGSVVDGTITTCHGFLANGFQGTNQTGFCLTNMLVNATNKALLLLGTGTVPSGHVGIQITLGTITQNTPHINGTATWNAAGVDMIAVKFNVTDTASGHDSSLLSLGVGGVPKCRVDKYGNVYANSFQLLANTNCYRTRWWQSQQNAAATTISTDGFATAPTATGTASVINNTNLGEYINYSSAASTNSDAGWKWTAETTRPRWSPSLIVKMRTPATITSIRSWVGLFSGDPMAQTSPSAGAISAMGFRFSTSIPDTNWQCVTSDGTTTTVVDSGVAYSASTTYLLTVDTSDNNTTVKFAINGVTVHSTSTTIPANTTALMPYVQSRTLTAAARDIMISTVRQESE